MPGLVSIPASLANPRTTRRVLILMEEAGRELGYTRERSPVSCPSEPTQATAPPPSRNQHRNAEMSSISTHT
jgi:hypothetical protein